LEVVVVAAAAGVFDILALYKLDYYYYYVITDEVVCMLS